ncbi:hypothetical protein PS870_06376 [Pseudomonas fluorescens]|uniref:YD repeat-containing protein n=1 Tax=Pseudomonas fluorescens TaxID=294 RepID=A0A5E7QIE9_PSEFL|nr:RHS repeat domain-containing protein [Pseudomonas fluorescens]VVP61574.1 hypothetical protein PS870_06376 [Pseudomonas fluorescens]
MSTVSDFFSQASNFVSAVSGQVDPRTGIYGININAGHLVANNLMGPALPLTLSYSPMNTANVGLGVGVSFGMSTYEGDSQSGMLTLGSGERYRVESGAVQQKKLDSFRFDLSGNRIFHKDGGIEILKKMGKVSVPCQIFNSTGHSITLTWGRDSRDNVVLTSVTDETCDPVTKVNTTLLFVTYSSTQVDMQVLPGRDEGYNVSLYLRNNYHLTKVTSDADAPGSDKPALSWAIEYTNMPNTGSGWGLWATSLTLPGGLVETVQYQQAQCFPDGSGLLPLPRAVRLSTADSTGTLSKTTYAYKDRNFLGFGSGISGTNWKKNLDNLYNASTSYRYGSTQTHTDEAGGTTVITRTYNNYHLLVSQTSTITLINQKCTTTQAIEYHIDPSKTFEGQSRQYQLPKTRTTTWSQGDQSRSEKTITKFDDSGNPLFQSIVSIDAAQQETPIQTKTEWEYYDSKGEAGCPAEPNGFTRFIKTMTVTSMTPVTLESPYAVSPHITTYTYAPLVTPPASQVAISTAIMVASEQHKSGTDWLSKVSYTYADNKTNDFCRLLSTESTHYPSGEKGPNPATTTVSTWTLDGGTLIENKTLTAGTQSLTSAQTQSLFTARTLSSTDALGIVNEAVYDRLGRVTEVTTAKGTDYTNTRTCEYKIKIKSDSDSDSDSDSEDGPFLITAIDANHNKIRTTCNAVGKPISVGAWLADDPSPRWKTIKTATYDTQMRPLTVTNMDYLTSVPTAERLEKAPPPDQSLTVSLDYDGWGQNHLNSVSDGVKHWSVTDPIAMTVTTYMTAENKDQTQSSATVTTYNYNRQPIKIEAYDPTKWTVPLPADAKASSTVLQQYDGWNQLREHRDELDRVTRYDYDVFGRTTVTTLPKLLTSLLGTQVKRVYSLLSPLAWLADIQVTAELESRNDLPKSVSMGTQVFDELGRVTQRSSGGRTWTATYDGSKGSLTSPASVTSPAKNTLNYQYIAALGGKVSRVEKSNTTSQNKVYTYNKSKDNPNKIVGGLLTASIAMSASDSSTITNTYALTGRLVTETLAPSVSATDYQYTVAGKATHYTDVTGITQVVEYDGYGRPHTISDSDVSAELTYDDLGRLKEWTTTDGKSKAALTIQVGLDGLGREIKRTLTSSQSNNSWVLEQTWYANHQLNTKVLSRNDKPARTETYTYDPRNRLTGYTVTGNVDDLPQDEKGNRITSQILTYDVYSNIKSIVSQFSDKTSDRMECTYLDPVHNTDDPCRLSKVTHDHSSYNDLTPDWMQYDLNGFLTNDGVGRTFENAGSVLEGYLSRVVVKGQDPKSSSYQYDAMNRLIKQDDVSLYYRGSKLVNQVEGKNGMRLLSGPGGNLAQIRTGINPSTWLSGIDANGSVLSVENGSTQVKLAYGPYGEQS